MNRLARFEKKFGRYAIPNLTLILIIGQALTYALFCTQPQDLQLLYFDANQILKGQVWRLFTFVILPPSTSLLWLLLSLFCFHFMGKALEAHWGDLRYNFYLLISYVATIAAGFAAPGIMQASYISFTVFLAFAYVYPDFKIYIYFIFPVKAKYLALLTWILLTLRFADSTGIERIHIVASIANFLIFFGSQIIRRIRHGKQSMQRRIEKMRRTFHKCNTCGKTERDDPLMEFRCCSKCAGSIEYCMEHLKEHEHVLAPSNV